MRFIIKILFLYNQWYEPRPPVQQKTSGDLPVEIKNQGTAETIDRSL